MKNQIIIFQDDGTADTIESQRDSLIINLQSNSIIEFPDKRLEVNSYSEKDFWDVTLILASIIGVIAAVWAANSAYKTLKKGNKDNQLQIEHLARLREIDEMRLKLMVKPNLRVGGAGYAGDGSLNFPITNEGKRCYIDDISVIGGNEIAAFNNLGSINEIKENERVRINGRALDSNHPRQITFIIRINYHDEGGFNYESCIQWNRSNLHIETTEL